MLQPVKKSRLSTEAIDQISQSILKGEYKPGSKLPPERELASQLGVSRTVVREAIRSLEIMGLVESQVGGGNYVKLHSADLVIEPISTYFNSEDCLIDEIVETRLILEPEVAKLAAERATEEDIADIENSINQMKEELSTGLSGINGDTAFHFALASAAHNNAMLKILSVIADLLHYNMKAALQADPDQETTMNDHNRILDAIKKHDSEKAKDEMILHLKQSFNRIKKKKITK